MAIYPFTPNVYTPYEFNPVLDGNPYLAFLTWPIYAQRWYINLIDSFGNRIFSKALIGSSAGIEIQSIVWVSGICYLSTIDPHGIKIGSTADLTISGAIPDAYNGKWRMLSVNKNILTFQNMTNSGSATLTGSLQYNIDILAGYGFTSTMIFREPSQQFETT